MVSASGDPDGGDEYVMRLQLLGLEGTGRMEERGSSSRCGGLHGCSGLIVMMGLKNYNSYVGVWQ